jgi:acyl CoA:acetate/3-ketoacid CoA transferase alpha subunit
MINKQADTVVQAIGKIDDGATIMVGGLVLRAFPTN